MTRSRLCGAAVALAATVVVSLSAQSPALAQFEVASVKLSAPGASEGFAVQPGGRFRAASIPLVELISIANQVYDDFQLLNAPDGR